MDNDVCQQLRNHESAILDDVLAQPPHPQHALKLTADTLDGLDRRFPHPLRLPWLLVARQTLRGPVVNLRP
jgi:hypothetical protein